MIRRTHILMLSIRTKYNAVLQSDSVNTKSKGPTGKFELSKDNAIIGNSKVPGKASRYRRFRVII